MFRVFNMGIGMIVVAAEADIPALQALFPEPTFIIGEVVEDVNHQVRLI